METLSQKVGVAWRCLIEGVQTGPGVDWWVDVAEVEFVSRQLSIKEKIIANTVVQHISFIVDCLILEMTGSRESISQI